MPDFYDSIGLNTNQGEENKLVNKALTAYPRPFLSGMKLEGGIQLWNPATETGLTLNTIDDNGVVWVVTDIEGWWTLPEMELPDLPRGWGDGSYDAIGRWANRIITLNGSFMPQNPEDAPAARNTLMEYLSPMVKTATAGYLIVTEDGITKKGAKVRLSGPPDITSVNARGRHDFSIGLKAVDPIKYEFVDGDPDGYKTETVNFSGSTVTRTITNDGNTPVPVIFELSANFPNPSGPSYTSIYNSDRDERLTILEGTGSNVKLEIDTYNREVLEVDYSVGTPAVTNGRAKVSVISDWVYLDPGTNDLVFTGFPSGTSCTIYYRSGWIG